MNSNIFNMGMQENKKKYAFKIKRVNSLQNITLKVLHEYSDYLLAKDEHEHENWYKSLPDHVKELLACQYPNLPAWMKQMLKEISEDEKNFVHNLEVFEKFKQQDKNIIIKHLLNILKKNWMTFSDDCAVLKLLKIIFSNTHNIGLVPYFRYWVINSLISNCDKIYHLALVPNEENRQQIIERHKLHAAFVNLLKMTEEKLLKIDENLTANLKVREFIVDASVKRIAEELINDFEIGYFEDFKRKFKGLKTNEQETALNYILGIYIANKPFSSMSEMIDYINCILSLFKETNKDLLLALNFLLNLYAQLADYIYEFGPVIIFSEKLACGDVVKFPIFVPKFYLIHNLKKCVLDEQYQDCFRLFESESIVTMVAKVLDLYYAFGDYRLLHDFIEIFFCKALFCLKEQADKVLICRFIQFINQLKDKQILDFESLKINLLSLVEAASITNKDETMNLLNESL